jgi:hypothetical protein
MECSKCKKLLVEIDKDHHKYEGHYVKNDKIYCVDCWNNNKQQIIHEQEKKDV